MVSPAAESVSFLSLTDSFSESRITVSEIAAQLAHNAEALCKELLPGGRCSSGEYRAGSVAGESLRVHLVGPRAGKWTDYATDEYGDMLDLAKFVFDFDTVGAIDWAKIWLGITNDGDRQPRRREPPPARQTVSDDSKRRMEAARTLWRRARPAGGTMVETYLRSRAITCPIPPSIRHIDSLKHGPTGLFSGAMIAGVQSPQGHVQAIQRTYLQAGGKADVSDPRMSLGSAPGGAVRLAAAQPVLGLAEGVESALSAMELFDIPVWCALGRRLSQMALPREVLRVVLFGDNGEPGRKAVDAAVQAFEEQGRKITTKFPPDGYGDWNDVLVAQRKAAA